MVAEVWVWASFVSVVACEVVVVERMLLHYMESMIIAAVRLHKWPPSERRKRID